MLNTAAKNFRELINVGDPNDLAHQYPPSKAEMREWGTYVESFGFKTRGAAASANIDPSLSTIFTQGFYAENDNGAAAYKNLGVVAPVPFSTYLHFQSADGQYWEIATKDNAVECYGAKGDGVFDNSAAINAALTFVGFGGRIKFSNKTYAAGSTLKASKGQLLEGRVPSGNYFGFTIEYGSALKWIGAVGGRLLEFGADPSVSVGQVKPSGGGLVNLQFYGTSSNELVYLSSCDNSVFKNLKLINLRDSSSATAFFCRSNTTEAGFENTNRGCKFDQIYMLAYGAGHCFRNFSNGTEGGLTFCTFGHLYGQMGGGSGAGNAFYFGSMDDCTFELISVSRNIGGTGPGLYLNGSSASGNQVSGCTFNMVHLGGGAAVVADGIYSAQNAITFTGVDEAPVIVMSNGANFFYRFLGGPFGAGQTALDRVAALQFINTRRTDQSLLDWWDDGITWQPYLTFGNSTTGWTYTSSGEGYRIGDNVTLFGTITVTAVGSATGSVRIGGIPAAHLAKLNSLELNVTSLVGFTGLTGGHLHGNNPINTGLVEIYQMVSVGSAGLSNTNFPLNATFKFKLTYRVA
jgi:hypothetical protein